MRQFPKLRKLLTNLGIALGAILFCCFLLVFAELILRCIYPYKVTTPVYFNDVAYKYDPDYLIALKPNLANYFKKSSENGGTTIKWKTNSHGFRGAELRDNSKIRIMVYGDSSIQAVFSELENTFCYKLENYLNDKGSKDIEVINCGINGAGPDQYYLKFIREADLYKPDVVIFNVFTDNDCGDIIRNRLFSLDSMDKLVQAESLKELDPLLRKKTLLYLDELASSLLLVRGARKLLKKTQLVNPEDQIKKTCDDEFAVYRKGEGQKFSHFADHYDIDLSCFPYSESSIVKLKLLSAILLCAKSFAASKNIKFLVSIQPSSRDITTNLPINYKILQKRYPKYGMDHLSQNVENICKEKDINYLNFYNLFTKNNPNSLYFTLNDDHWNDYGQDLAAKEAATYIRHNLSLFNTNK